MAGAKSLLGGGALGRLGARIGLLRALVAAMAGCPGPKSPAWRQGPLSPPSEPRLTALPRPSLRPLRLQTRR